MPVSETNHSFPKGGHTMTKQQRSARQRAAKAIAQTEPDLMREAVRGYLHEVLEQEMTAAVGAAKGGRRVARGVGKVELRVPQDRDGRFSTEVFERYQRSEKALVGALAEMYIQGVSTRKVRAITEELCGHSVSASALSAINQRLDASLD